jgi:hypothetical protein
MVGGRLSYSIGTDPFFVDAELYRIPIWLEHCWFVSNRGGRYTAANVPTDLLDLLFPLLTP